MLVIIYSSTYIQLSKAVTELTTTRPNSAELELIAGYSRCNQLINQLTIHGCTHLSLFRFRFNADNTMVAATAKSLSVSSAMFLVRETWMVLCATCIQVSCIKFLVQETWTVCHRLYVLLIYTFTQHANAMQKKGYRFIYLRCTECGLQSIFLCF